MAQQNNETLKQSLQETADKLHLVAQEDLKKAKNYKKINYGFTSMVALWLLLSDKNATEHNPLLSLMIIGSMLAYTLIDYKERKEALMHDVLFGTIQKAVNSPEYMAQQNKKDLYEHLAISDNVIKSIQQRRLASWASLGSILTLTGGCLLDKISLPTATLAGSLIMASTAYWQKNLLQNLNKPIKERLSPLVHFKDLSSRERG